MTGFRFRNTACSDESTNHDGCHSGKGGWWGRSLHYRWVSQRKVVALAIVTVWLGC